LPAIGTYPRPTDVKSPTAPAPGPTEVTAQLVTVLKPVNRVSRIAATFKNGVLRVTLPKIAEAQTPARKIEVKAS
jgi:hypothetical protein